jgi:acid phosphatase type 7
MRNFTGTRKTFAAAACLALALLLSSCRNVSPPSVPRQLEPAPAGINICIYGDSRSGHGVHQRIVNAIMRLKPVAVFHTGDLVANGRDPGQWAIFNRIVAPLRLSAAFYPALGNHERNAALYFADFKLPGNGRWYWVDIDAIHFIVLDTGSPIGPGSEQYNWLEKYLQRTNPADFTVAVFHHPPLSVGPHAYDEKKLHNSIVPLFEKYDVDLVFAGHDHDYQRFFYNNIHYVVTGGGGAPLYSQKRASPYLKVFLNEYHFCNLTNRHDGQLRVDVFDGNLRVLDSFTVSK